MGAPRERTKGNKKTIKKWTERLCTWKPRETLESLS